MIQKLNWKSYQMNLNAEPTKLIFEIVQAAGNVGLIDSVTVFQGFVAVKRRTEALNEPKDSFNIKNYIISKAK